MCVYAFGEGMERLYLRVGGKSFFLIRKNNNNNASVSVKKVSLFF